ncbi:hypothetical protein SCHPADRAFT_887995 [Schizopora paradoxa]|uniref:Uncharacterized protein n=1 Tax=Schizopora paradoxa TaxID=27342 RepID=A0A0H2SGA7_9AGAM|nr:hypothetical protein SCHPADRAFT_887995 [Schizopora paradoxa]
MPPTISFPKALAPSKGNRQRRPEEIVKKRNTSRVFGSRSSERFVVDAIQRSIGYSMTTSRSADESASTSSEGIEKAKNRDAYAGERRRRRGRGGSIWTEEAKLEKVTQQSRRRVDPRAVKEHEPVRMRQTWEKSPCNLEVGRQAWAAVTSTDLRQTEKSVRSVQSYGTVGDLVPRSRSIERTLPNALKENFYVRATPRAAATRRALADPIPMSKRRGFKAWVFPAHCAAKKYDYSRIRGSRHRYFRTRRNAEWQRVWQYEADEDAAAAACGIARRETGGIGK